MLPRLGDREALTAIVEGHDLAPFSDRRIFHAWKYFRRHVEHWARTDSRERLRKLLETIAQQLSLVVITIAEENPYEIFESLNSTGLPLAESDLIRNFVFMQIPLAKQQEFFDRHWRKLEDMFDATDEEPAVPMTPFYRDYLMRNGRYAKEDATFVDFKLCQEEANLSPEQQVQELKRYAPLELMLRRPRLVKKAALRRLLCHVDGMEITTAYPLLFNLLDRHEQGRLQEDELCGCLQDMISFVLRRSICGESTRQYNRWFVEAITALRDSPRQDLQTYFLNRRWPDDNAFKERLVDFPLYRREGKKTRVILEAIEENFGHKEKVGLRDLSIEHIMPQTITNNSAGKSWKAMLGENWQEFHERYLHTLGNLTLTGYNPDLSNSSFEKKKELLADSHLDLNAVFEPLSEWNAERIRSRSANLAEHVARLWPRPKSEVQYSASAEALPEPQELSEGEKRRLEYWRQVDMRLEERGIPPELIVPQPKTWVDIPLGKTGCAFIQLGLYQQKRLYVTLGLDSEVGEAIEARLLKEKAKIEHQLGYHLQWDSGDIYVEDDGIMVWDREDWPVQHDWFGDRLDDYLRVLKPRVEELEAEAMADPELRSKVEKQEQMVEYWKSCASALKGSAVSFRESEPQSGRKYCRFERIDTGIYFGAQYYPDTPCICIYFGVAGSAGRKMKSAFKEVAEQRLPELAAAIGQELEWSEPYVSAWTEARIEDKADWPRQHKWVRETAEKLLVALKTRLDL